MKYMLKQRLVAFGNDFDVFDESGKKLFYFDSKIGGFRPRIIIEDASGRQIGLIKKKLFTFWPTYLLYDQSGLIAQIHKNNFALRKTFVIKPVGAPNIKVIGSFVEHNYHFYEGGQKVAESSKKWFTGKDSYGIDVEKSSQLIPILSAAVIIDIQYHPKRLG